MDRPWSILAEQGRSETTMNNWHSIPTDHLLEELDARPQGLTAKQAKDLSLIHI